MCTPGFHPQAAAAGPAANQDAPVGENGDTTAAIEAAKPGKVLAAPAPEARKSRSGRVVRGRGQLRYRTPSPEGRSYGILDLGLILTISHVVQSAMPPPHTSCCVFFFGAVFIAC